ncbi:MAG: hypothetical protein H8K04_08920 [Nitrospira sp.]
MPIPFVAHVALSLGVLAVLPPFSIPTTAVAQVQCWTPRQDEGPVTDKRWARYFKAMSAAEAIVKQSRELMDSPVPVRMRTTMAASAHNPWNSRLFVRAYPEQTSVGIKIWEGDCRVNPQADRVDGSIGRVSVYFNYLSKEMFMGRDDIPKRTGTVAGYPDYGGWVIISKNERLPWIPQTLGDRLDRLGASREKAMADWHRGKAARKAPDRAMAERTAALLRRNDPAGADNYMENIKRLTADVQAAQARDALRDAYLSKLLGEYRTYRASFTAEQLAKPAVWADPEDSARKAVETQIAAIQELNTDDRRRVDEVMAQSLALEREAVAAENAGNRAEAQQLRAQAGSLSIEAERDLNDHIERAALQAEELRDAFELKSLKPGTTDQALAYKMDPAFPDRSKPGKIQVIAVFVPTLTEEEVYNRPELVQRKAWLDQVKFSIDYASLAALLD